jgi:hypothetical protein
MRARSCGALSLVVLTTTVLAACGVSGLREGAPGVEFAAGWTELPLPPEVRDGAALVWAGREVIAWGGCDPARLDEDCYPTDDGFAFDPSTREWSPVPPAPRSGIDPEAVWTGREALFFYAEGWKLKGVAYDPVAGSWRTLPNAPIQPRFGAVHVWTGQEAIVWGGGRPVDDTVTTGAAYAPAADTWRQIADAPIGLNLASGLWTGREMVVFGSLLDHRNRAETDTSVGAAYDPATDAWRELPPSGLSPQATSADWVGGRMVAWDYGAEWQAYDPRTDRWTTPQRMPLEPSECYPVSVVVGEVVFAFFCGQGAIFDATTESWRPVKGGMLREEIEGHGTATYKLWRFADLVPVDDVVLFLAEGITTVGDEQEVCYGCPGSPHAFWAYRLEAA